jgi:hypothetical protein
MMARSCTAKSLSPELRHEPPHRKLQRLKRQHLKRLHTKPHCLQSREARSPHLKSWLKRNLLHHQKH